MVFNARMNPREDRFILFRSAGGVWAVAAAGVREVLPTAQMDRPAGAPRALAGFMLVDGAPLAVVRLAALFGTAGEGADELYSHILRLPAAPGATPLGLLVDRVTDVDARADGMAPLEPSQSLNGALIGNLVVGGELVPLLDWGRLLLLEEQLRIEDLAAAARQRLAELDAAGA